LLFENFGTIKYYMNSKHYYLTLDNKARLIWMFSVLVTDSQTCVSSTGDIIYLFYENTHIIDLPLIKFNHLPKRMWSVSIFVTNLDI
jgi:hypothetical protein